MKLETSPLLDLQYISRAYETIIVDGFDIELSPKEIWCFDSNRKVTPSWNPHGKDHTSSMRLYLEEHID
jgi:hypothetical protein